jgi:hypothetical protein
LIFLPDEEGIVESRVKTQRLIGHARVRYHTHDTLFDASAWREGRDMSAGVVQR